MLEEGLASSILDAARQPLALALEIVELRAYAQAKVMVEEAKSQDDLPDHPMVAMVWEVTADLVQAERERRYPA